MTADAAGLVVVGASLAGLRSVEAARRSGFDGSITLIGAEPHLPYDRPPLSKSFLESEAGPTTFRSEAELRGELGVELCLGEPADGLDTDAQTVSVAGRDIPYSGLVIATGAAARTLPHGLAMAGVHTLRTLDDAIAVRAALDRRARTVVVGGGFIGSEIAAAATRRGLSVTVVDAAPVPLVRAVGEEMGAACAALHGRNGTRLRCGVSVSGIEGDQHVESVLLSDGTVLEADLVVVGTGASPSTGWLEGSGLTLDDGIVCDETLWAGVEGIYAAGDVARWTNPAFGRSMRLEHWTSAAEQGAHAGRAAVDPTARHPFSTIPYFWSDWYNTRIQFLGVPTDDVTVVDGSVDTGEFLALYRSDDRLVGVLALNRPQRIMKFRALIARGENWAAAHEFAGSSPRRATVQ